MDWIYIILFILYVSGFIFTSFYAKGGGISNFDTIVLACFSWIGAFAIFLFDVPDAPNDATDEK